MNATLIVPVGQLNTMQGIVNIRASGRIHRTNGQMLQIQAPLLLLLADLVGQRGQAVQHRLRKRIARHVMLQQEHLVLGLIVADETQRL